MKRARKLPELLAPAGDMEALTAAILGGADAVYVGGKRFGARAFAKNFDEEELRLAVRLCHIHGVRLYVTLNTLALDKEVSDALEYARLLYEIGVDAVIIADVGLAALIRKELPSLELHASTQMGAHNTAGVDFAAELGISRVVLARECSYNDIKKITEESSAECEVFLHGALCVCHSGQCLFSSMVGGRSGNRGECAQPCRLPYNKGKYILSLKDLSLAKHIEELLASGVSSLKIEGRMKSPEYVYEVTRIYRALLDEGRAANASEEKRLAAAFSRGGFTDGYFTQKLFSAMTGVRSEEDKKASKDLKTDEIKLPKISLKAKALFKNGEKCSLSFTSEVISRWDSGESKSITVSVQGDIPNEAQNAPLTKEGLRERLSKLGGTPFDLPSENAEILLDGGLNLPPSAINALRREALDRLLSEYSRPLSEILEIEAPEYPAKTKLPESVKPTKNSISSALFFKADVLSRLIERSSSLLSGIDAVFVPLFDYKELGESVRKATTGVYLPPVVMESQWEEVRSALSLAEELGAKYALLGNISHFALIKDTKLIPVADFRLNTSNKYTASIYRALGAESVVLSPELTLPQARDIGGAVITLGRVPLMITERCFTKESFGCENCGSASLSDRLGLKFPMLREYKHRNIIFNSAPTYMGDKTAELRASRIEYSHFIFSSESAEECVRLLSAYRKGAPLNTPHRRVGKRN